MTNRTSIRSLSGYPSFVVVLADGFRVPANSLTEAEGIAARFTARGIAAAVKVN